MNIHGVEKKVNSTGIGQPPVVLGKDFKTHHKNRIKETREKSLRVKRTSPFFFLILCRSTKTLVLLELLALCLSDNGRGSCHRQVLGRNQSPQRLSLTYLLHFGLPGKEST